MGDASQTTKFWANDPCILFTDISLFPTAAMSKNEKLNALTRLAVIIAVVMAVYRHPNWPVFLTLALLIVVLLKFGPAVDPRPEEFTRTPTYVDNDFHQTIVSPTFAEEHQIPPPAYDIYDAAGSEEKPYYPDMPKPQSYPYGQYRTITNNLLPQDSYSIDMTCGGERQAREFANNYWTRQSLAYRDNLTRVFKKKLNRRFRHNCADTFSPYSSY